MSKKARIIPICIILVLSIIAFLIYSSSIEEIGNRSQFPLFRLAPEFINKNNYNYWLRNIASNQYYVIIKVGVAKTEFASLANYVRPFWLIG